MRRVLFASLLVMVMIVGCGGPPPDTTVADPPKSIVLEKSDNPKINQLVEGWKSAVPTEMTNDLNKIKPESIEQKVYKSTASLQEIADFYKTLTEKGWHEVPNMPGIQEGVLISGYENGNTTLAISAVDATKFGGAGIVIYTAKGTK